MSDQYTYPSGFRVGELVVLIPGQRKYNTHIFLSVGDRAVVVDPPNEDFPVDAVQVRMVSGGVGALDAGILKRYENPAGQAILK